MMTIKYKILFFCSASFILIQSSCDKDQYGPWVTGELIGYAEIFDEFGNPDTLADLSQVSVALEGTKFTSPANSEGQFQFNDLRSGIYTLVYSYPGFPDTKYISHKFIGGGSDTLPDPKVLLPESTTTVSSMTIEYDPEIDDELISVTISQQSTGEANRRVIFFLNTDPEVNRFNYDEYWLLSFPRDSHTNFTTPGTLSIYFMDSFESGTTVYIKAYGIAGNYLIWESAYWDYELENLIFPSVNEDGASQTMSFTWP